MQRFAALFLWLTILCGMASAAPDRTLRINVAAEPETMDPSLNYSVSGARAIRGLMDSLVRLDAQCVAQPSIATSWEHSDDLKTWTFKLRKDAKWHNGDRVTAKDFVFGVKRTLTKSLAAPYADNVRSFVKGGKAYYEAGGLESAAALEGVTAVDDYTVRYDLEYPTPFFLQLVDLTCWYPISETAIKAGGEKWSMSPKTYIGNGPYRLAEYRSKDRMILKKADTYWDKDNIFFDTVEIYMIESMNTELAAFRTRSLDVTHGVALPDVPEWKDKPEYNLISVFGTYYLSFNVTKPPFTDARVRRAFNIAINRRVLTDRVFRRGEVPSQGIVPENTRSARGGTWREHAGDLIGKMDIQEARRLLKEAGYDEAHPLPSVTYTYDTKEEHKQIAEQLQSMWKAGLGADVKLQNVDWGVRLSRGRSGEFEIIRNGWYGDYLDAMTFMEMWITGSALNDSKFSNKRYDELIEGARKEMDPVKREDLMMEAERLLVRDEAPIIPLMTYADPLLIQTDVKGVVRNAVGGLDYTRAKRVE